MYYINMWCIRENKGWLRGFCSEQVPITQSPLLPQVLWYRNQEFILGNCMFLKLLQKWSEVKVAQSCLTLCDPMEFHSPWNSLGQNTGVGSLSLLQGIFPTQGSNPDLPHCRWIFYQLSHKGSPKEGKWKAKEKRKDVPIWMQSSEEQQGEIRKPSSTINAKIEETNRMGKTRDLFKKIRDTKGTIHKEMGSKKDRYGRDLTKAEDIKKRWLEYTEERYKKRSSTPR